MDKKILILKNDRVGDLFHSLRNIENLREYYSEYTTDIYLSKINIRFANILTQSKLNITEVNYRLTILEKFNLIIKLLINSYEYVLILSPKNFYFFLPIIFRNTKFLGICVDNETRKRPSIMLRKYLFKYEVNNRTKNIRKNPIYAMEKKLIENIIPPIKKQLPYSEIKYNDNEEPINVLFHYKSDIFGEIDKNIEQFHKLFLKLISKHNIKIRISTDLDFKIKKNNFDYIFKQDKNIKFLGPIDADDLIREVGKSDLIISPHGAITCIGAYFNKNIIDIFDRNITRNAFCEFRPYTLGNYQFLFKSLDINKTFIKISLKINNLF